MIVQCLCFDKFFMNILANGLHIQESKFGLSANHLLRCPKDNLQGGGFVMKALSLTFYPATARNTVQQLLNWK